MEEETITPTLRREKLTWQILLLHNQRSYKKIVVDVGAFSM